MKEHPILFSGPMVRAIIEGRKTQTRRVITARNSIVQACEFAEIRWDSPVRVDDGPFSSEGTSYLHAGFDQADMTFEQSEVWTRIFPRIEASHHLWVKETFKAIPGINRPAGYYVPGTRFYGRNYYYRADNDDPLWADNPWRPSIFMPRVASRLTLEVTSVRAERLQDISEEDAWKEGVTYDSTDMDIYTPYQTAFRELWNTINGKKHPWSSNPWVWVYTFKLLENKTAAKEAA